MILKINDRETEVRFGIRFIRELDKANMMQREGLKFGAGLEMKVPMLFTYDAVALSDVLYAGTSMEKNRPTIKDIDDYVESHENIERLFEEVLDELKKSSVTKLKVCQLEGNLKEQVEKEEAKIEE